MDIFRIHSITLRLGLTHPAHILSPLGHYQKCGTARTSPCLLKEYGNQDWKLKSEMGLKLLPTF